MKEKTTDVERISVVFFCGAPSGARFLRVKVPNSPGSGNDIHEEGTQEITNVYFAIDKYLVGVYCYKYYKYPIGV